MALSPAGLYPGTDDANKVRTDSNSLQNRKGYAPFPYDVPAGVTVPLYVVIVIELFAGSTATFGHVAPISEFRAFSKGKPKFSGKLFMLPWEQWHLPNTQLKNVIKFANSQDHTTMHSRLRPRLGKSFRRKK